MSTAAGEPSGSDLSSGGGNQSPLEALRAVPRRTWMVFFICLGSATFANLDILLFTFVLTDISAEFEWSFIERGWYLFITFALAGVIITQLGVLTDRLGRKKMLLSTTVLTSVFVAVLTWVPNTLSLVVARTLGFATGGAQSPITITTVIEESPPRLRGLFSGVLQIAFPIGAFLGGYFLIPWVYENWGWRYIFLLALVFLPYAWVIYRYLPESRQWEAAQAASDPGTKGPTTWDLFKPGLRRKTLLLFFGQLLYVFAYGATFLLVPYFQEHLGWEAGEAFQTVGLSYGIGAVGYVAAAWFGEFIFNRRTVIIAWMWLGGAAFAVMVWLADGWWQIIISFSAMTFFFYGAYAVVATFIAENFPAELRATAVSFSGSFAIELGFGGGPLVFSYVTAATSWELGFTLCAVVPVILAGFLFLFLKPVPKEE